MERFQLKKVSLVGRHSSWVTCLSSCGRMGILLSASRDRTVRHWTLDTRVRKAWHLGVPVEPPPPDPPVEVILKGHRDAVSGCQLTENGDFVVSCSWDRSIKIWHLEDHTCHSSSTTRNASQMNCVTFSEDNRQIFTGSQEFSVWNVLGECKYSAGSFSGGHKDIITAVAMVPKAASMVTVGWDARILLWDTKTMKVTKELNSQGILLACDVSPDASLLAVGGKQAQVELWDLKEGVVLHSYDVEGTVYSLQFSPKDYALAVATECSIEILDLEQKCICAVDTGQLPEKIPWATCLSYAPDGEALYVGSADGQIWNYRVEKAQ